jgi:hypothetical protein
MGFSQIARNLYSKTKVLDRVKGFKPFLRGEAPTLHIAKFSFATLGTTAQSFPWWVFPYQLTEMMSLQFSRQAIALYSLQFHFTWLTGGLLWKTHHLNSHWNNSFKCG